MMKRRIISLCVSTVCCGLVQVGSNSWSAFTLPVDEGDSVDNETVSKAQAQMDRLVALEQSEQKNRHAYQGPLFAAEQHVSVYFETFDDVLSQVSTLQFMDEKQLTGFQMRRKRLGIHRDDMASLMGLVGDLRVSLAGKLKPFHEELERTRLENAHLKEELEQKEQEMAGIRKIK